VALAAVAGAVWIITGFRSTVPFLAVKIPQPPHADIVRGLAILYGVFITLAALSDLLLKRTTFNSRRRRFLAAAVPAAACGYGVFVARTNIRLVESDISVPGLDANLNGLRIVQITDIHYGPFLGRKDLERAVAMANETRAHLALFTGDFITNPNDDLAACLKSLSEVKTDAGSFGCHGNHEFYCKCEAQGAALALRHGIRILRSESQALSFGSAQLNLAGVDYQSAPLHYLEGAESMRLPGALNLLMSHTPRVFPAAAQQGWDLTIAGHTHGGQIGLELFGVHLTPLRLLTPFIQGLYRSGKSAMFVSRGIGTIGAPIRAGAPPEVNLLRLVRA
jgi:predicted MPP superfamily phosphohydrolase